ncbi:MAG TPA: rRNA maturation RNase YbeY [Actinomycetota bacterium]
MSDDRAEPPPGRVTAAGVLLSNRQGRQVDEQGLAALAGRVLQAEGAEGQELSLSFVTAEEMANLHQRYMGEEGPTDVLSFPMGEEGLLGDVVVCPEEAERNNPDLGSELRLLVTHGVLHLLGYDHQKERDRLEMWAKQDAYAGANP